MRKQPRTLKATKNELEVTLQTFTIEQEKLHDNYEKRKQELNENSDRLHKELEKLETDTSTACKANRMQCIDMHYKRSTEKNARSPTQE